MTLPSEKLAELGLELPEVAKPVAAYVPAIEDRGVVRTSGQLALVRLAKMVRIPKMLTRPHAFVR